MKRIIGRRLHFLVIAVLAAGFGTSGFAASFKVTRLRGRVQIKSAQGAAFSPAKKGGVYPFGTTVKTARNSYCDVQLSPGNKVRILSRSVVTVTRQPAGARVVRLNMPRGRVKVALKKFPANTRFEIESPVGVCAAVGTAFTFGVQPAGKSTTAMTIQCTENAVTFSGELFGLDTVAAGGSLTASIYESAAGWLVRFFCRGQAVQLHFGGSSVGLAPGSTAAFAIPRTGAGGPDFSRFAMRVERGSASVGGSTITRADGNVLIRGNTSTRGADADALFRTVRGAQPTPGPGQVPGPGEDVPQSPGGTQ